MEFEVKSPILGFENVAKMRLEKIDEVFLRLSNAALPTPIFTLVNPFVLLDYSFEVPTAIEVLLDIKDLKSPKILTANIMVVYKDIADSTINFLAPLVFNFDNHTMAQVVLDAAKYPHYGIAVPLSRFLKAQDSRDSGDSRPEDSAR